MFISLLKSTVCLVFFILLWFSPFFRRKLVQYFNYIEYFLIKNKKVVTITTFSLYIIIIILLQFYHATDGDETQAWLIARDSESLWKMYSHMKYDGHPALWHTILFPMAKAGLSFHVIYVFNYLFAITAVILWLRFAPFPLFVRLLLPFVHIFLTEYSIFAKSYVLSVCLLFTGLTLYKNLYNKWLLWSLAFFLLANTNIPSALLTCSFVLFLFLNRIFLKNKTDGKAMIVIGVGILLACAQLYPPEDLAKDLSEFRYQITPEEMMASLITGFSLLSPVIYLALIIQVVFSFKNKFALYAFLFAQMALFFLFFFKYHGGLRHHFFLILSILMFFWIGGIKENKKSVVHLFLFCIMTLMAINGISRAITNIKTYNQYIKEMSLFIDTNIQPDSTTFIACHPDDMSVGILPYLDIKSLYMPDDNRWGSYVIWDQQRVSGNFKPDTVQNVINLSKEHPGYRGYYYLTIFELPPDSVKYYRIKLLKKTTNRYLLNVGSPWNTYYLYKLPE